MIQLRKGRAVRNYMRELKRLLPEGDKKCTGYLNFMEDSLNEFQQNMGFVIRYEDLIENFGTPEEEVAYFLNDRSVDTLRKEFSGVDFIYALAIILMLTLVGIRGTYFAMNYTYTERKSHSFMNREYNAVNIHTMDADETYMKNELQTYELQERLLKQQFFDKEFHKR